MLTIFYCLLAIFLANLAAFIFVLTHNRKSMWSGFTLTLTIMSLGVLTIGSLVLIDNYFPKQQQLISDILILAAVSFLFLVIAFILLLIVIFIYNGIKILIKEGTRWTNFLSLGTGVLIIIFIFVYPQIDRFIHLAWARFLYLFLTLCIFYLIFIMMMYTLTAWLNLINIHQKPLDYIVVLGAGLNGKKVTPLLASRINRGIEIYRKNPGSKIIMSG